jgi:hypothetical protein
VKILLQGICVDTGETTVLEKVFSLFKHSSRCVFSIFWREGRLINQLDMFELDRIEQIKHVIEKHNYPYDLVAVNKMYSHYGIVYNRADRELYVFSARFDEIELMYTEHSEFGTNYYVIDERFRDFESVPLRKGKQYTSCSRRELDLYLADGWRIV